MPVWLLLLPVWLLLLPVWLLLLSVWLLLLPVWLLVLLVSEVNECYCFGRGLHRHPAACTRAPAPSTSSWRRCALPLRHDLLLALLQYWAQFISGRCLQLPPSSAAPPASQAISGLVAAGKCPYVCSQNVDSLHLWSGVPRSRIAELHGNCFAERCRGCGAEYARDFQMETVREGAEGQSEAAGAA